MFASLPAVPLVVCRSAVLDVEQRSMRIEWDNIQTGGLGLTSASIEYMVVNSTGNSTPVQNPVIDINGGVAILRTLPQAGLNYIFSVTTENDVGESIPSQCPPIFLVIGEHLLYSMCS